MNDKSRKLSFYAKKVKKSEFNSKYYDSELSSYIPSKESYDYSIEQSNTFSIDDIDINNDYIILISIYSQAKTKINLISSYYFGSEMVNLLPHTEQMFHIRKGEDLKVNVINNYALTMKNYLFDTVTVKGKAKTTIDKSSKVIEGNYIANIQDKDQQEEFMIANTNESDLVVIIKYNIRDVNNNIVELSNDMMNVIDMGFNFFPLAAYFPIENIDTINNIMNVNFDDIEYKQKNNNKDDFGLKGYIVDNSFIEERKKNSSAIPASSQMKSVYYSDEHMGFISYKKEQNDDGKYLFVLIDKSATNKNEYAKITTSLFTYNEEVPKYSLPQMKYIYGTCEKGKKVLFKMDTKANDEKVYEIEFASSPYINTENKTQFLIYSIESYKETPTFANETDIIKSSQFDNGKNVIIVNTDKSILFTVIANDYDMDFAVKYKTLKSQEDIVVYSYNKTVNTSYDENAKTLSVTFTKIKSNDQYEDATYSIKIFNNTSVLNNKDFIHTIYPFSSEVFSFIFEDSIHIKEDSENITQQFNLSNSIENGFYMTVVASFSHNEYEINKLAYDIAEIKKENVTPDKGKNNKWWIALLIIILILGIVIGGLLFYRNMKKAKMQSNPRISENNQALIPENDV